MDQVTGQALATFRRIDALLPQRTAPRTVRANEIARPEANDQAAA
jgi:hypothetical protein